ncbi:MAG TPA: hypothetical protein VF457_17680 [Burkholderiaceae bacterium]
MSVDPIQRSMLEMIMGLTKHGKQSAVKEIVVLSFGNDESGVFPDAWGRRVTALWQKTPGFSRKTARP